MIVEPVVTEHAAAAAEAWLNRCEAVGRPDYSVVDCLMLDNLVTTHLHGIGVACREDPEAAAALIEPADPASVFTCAAVAVQAGADLTSVTEACTDVDTARALASALAWVGGDTASRNILQLLTLEDPFHLHAAISGAACQRLKIPPIVLNRPEITEHPRFLKAIGEIGATDWLSFCRQQLDAEDDDVRFHAAASTVLLGHADGREVLKSMALGESPHAEPACVLASRGLTYSHSADWLQRLARKPERSRLAILTAGAIGDPVLVPWLIEFIKTGVWAPLAGEAFSMITGVDLELHDLTSDGDDADEVKPDEASASGDEAITDGPAADDALPHPNADLVQQWWDRNQGRFQNGQRYLAGLQITEDHLWQVLETGFQRQRIAAAVELALLTPEYPLFNVFARSDRQKKLLQVRRIC